MTIKETLGFLFITKHYDLCLTFLRFVARTFERCLVEINSVAVATKVDKNFRFMSLFENLHAINNFDLKK